MKTRAETENHRAQQSADFRRFITAVALAERWSTTVAAVYARTSRGEIPFARFGKRQLRYPLDEIERYERAAIQNGAGA